MDVFCVPIFLLLGLFTFWNEEVQKQNIGLVGTACHVFVDFLLG